LAVLAYEAGTKQYDVHRQVIQVARPKHDDFPQLDRDLPVVEFLPEVPRDSSSVERGRRQRFAPGGASEPKLDDAWALGHGHEWLPVRNAAPIRLDVVLNFANWLDPELRQSPSATLYRRRIGRLLQIGSVLSHLGLANGCVRVSGMDVN